MTRLAWLFIGCAACGNITRKADDGGVPKDASSDAAPDAAMFGQSREVVSGAGRASGPTYTIDMEVGHVVSQKKTTGPTYTLEGNAAVKP
jgi:hypothetical protein